MECLCVVLISELVDFVFSVIYDLYDEYCAGTMWSINKAISTALVPKWLFNGH